MSEQEFLQRNAEVVFNLALRLTGSWTDAEDLAQDALLRALKALPDFRGESRASTWMYRITVNTWKNRVRYEKRRLFWRTVTLGLVGGCEDGECEVRDVKADDPPPDADLAEGQTIAVGACEFGVLHTPGHTPGHVTFAGHGLALVGDVLFAGSIGRTDLPRGDHATLIRSIREQLWPLGRDVTFIPGHGPTSTFGEERESNPFVADSMLERAQP